MIRYSVVVPTRDRADTLAVTLSGLASIGSSRLEVIVVDNAGGADTGTVIRRAAERLPLSHIRTDRVLGMSENWELGLRHATGDYLTVIGDDDALVPHVVDIADSLLGEHRPAILTWSPFEYYWPGCVDRRLRNYMIGFIGDGWQDVSCRTFVAAWQAEPCRFLDSPSIYQSFVARPFVDAVIAKFGRYFIDMIPDISSGVVNAFEAVASSQRVIKSMLPLSIRGTSHNSFGYAFRQRIAGRDRLAAYRAAEAGGATPVIHPDLVDAPSLSAVLASVWLRLVGVLSAAYPVTVRVSQSDFVAKLAQAMLDEIADQPDARDPIIADVERLLARQSLPFDSVTVPPEQPPAPLLPIVAPSRRPGETYVRARVDLLGVTDVAAAMRFAAALSPWSGHA